MRRRSVAILSFMEWMNDCPSIALACWAQTGGVMASDAVSGISRCLGRNRHDATPCVGVAGVNGVGGPRLRVIAPPDQLAVGSRDAYQSQLVATSFATRATRFR